MQSEMMKRASELLADGTVVRVLGWKNGEFVYERRVLGTHLSKAKCDDFIYQNIGPTGEYVYLHGHVEEEEA